MIFNKLNGNTFCPIFTIINYRISLNKLNKYIYNKILLKLLKIYSKKTLIIIPKIKKKFYCKYIII